MLSHLSLVLQPYLSRPRWLVGLSGGRDSVVLLNLCYRFWQSLPMSTRPELLAIHINHGISPWSDDWQAHCESLCEDLGITLRVRRLKVMPLPGQSLEQSAREYRYREFGAELGAEDLLLLAHHRDDQVETVLFRLLRGSGVRGLAGMPRQRCLGTATLLRPLLATPRAEIEAYAIHHGLRWVDDESNQDSTPDRNYLRLQVLPELRQRWPGLDGSVSRSADLCRETDDLLAEVAEGDLADLGERREWGACSLDCTRLSRLSRPRQRNVLRYWLGRHGVPALAERQLSETLAHVVGAREDADPALVWQGWQLRRFRQRLHLLPVSPSPLPEGVALSFRNKSLWVPGCGPVYLGQRECISKAESPRLRVVFRYQGERIHLAGRKGGKSLKKLAQELGVPPWWRERMPLLYAGDELLSVGGMVWTEAGARWRDYIGLSFDWEVIRMGPDEPYRPRG